MPLSADTPVYPGDPQVELSQIASVEKDGFRDSKLTVDTHNGTHIDAPAHMVAGGKTLDEFDMGRLVGPGVLVDARTEVTVEALREVTDDSIVLLWAGLSDRFQANDYYDKLPRFADGAVAELVQRHPKMVGIDAGSIDGEPFAVHKALLGADILLAENLVGLSALAGKQFEVIALPLKLDVDGSPARVIARVA